MSAIHCTKNLYSMATSEKLSRPASCLPKDFVLFILLLNGKEDLKFDVFSQMKVKEVKKWKQAYFFFGFC